MLFFATNMSACAFVPYLTGLIRMMLVRAAEPTVDVRSPPSQHDAVLEACTTLDGL